MAWYIDGEALYEQTAKWEAAALAQVEKLCSKPLKDMSADEISDWRKWSCILNERSAFKHDVADSLVADAVEVVRCKDCKYYCESFPYNTCTAFEPVVIPDEYDFCSHGVRKETVNGCCIQ